MTVQTRMPLEDTPAAQIVLDLPPGAGNVRNSEGSFAALAGGRLLYVYTRFGESGRDDGRACLAARWSEDGGLTWTGKDQILIETPPHALNVMSVSLLRLADCRLAMFHLIKDSPRSWPVVWRQSDDEGQTWTEPRVCSVQPGCHVLNNDRAMQLSSGRIVLPVAHRDPAEPPGDFGATITCLLSDDGGVTWRSSSSPAGRVGGVWTQEPLVVERTDGSLWLLCRTQVGCQYQSESADGGETWSPLRPSGIVSTLSPASVKRIPSTGDLLMVWNNVAQPWIDWNVLARSPLHAAISRDDGRTWSQPVVLADHPGCWYCYTAIHFVDDAVLLAHSAGSGQTWRRLARQRLVRVSLASLYGG